jgi:hypothetical protein
MKFYVWIFLTGSVLSSCKKIYTCECNTTVTLYSNTDKQFYTSVLPASKTPYSEKMREKQAMAACQHEQIATETNFTNAMTDNGRYPLGAGESISTSLLLVGSNIKSDDEKDNYSTGSSCFLCVVQKKIQLHLRDHYH